jgi:hypothetical protein
MLGMPAFLDEMLRRLMAGANLDKLGFFFWMVFAKVCAQPALSVLDVNHGYDSW